MKKKAGFSLIEITFGLLISSILSVMLFQVNGTLSRLSQSIESSLGYIRTVPLLIHQLERDLSAAYVPLPIYDAIVQDWKKKKTGQQVKPLLEGASSADPEKKEVKGVAEKKDPLEKWTTVEPFFCQVEEGAGLKISVITTSALPSFQYTVPRLVKVVYQVRPGKDDSETFDIFRLESVDFFEQEDSDVVEKDSALLVSGIESLKVRLFGQEKPAEDTGGASDAKDSDTQGDEKKMIPPTETSGWNKADSLEQFAGLLPLRIEFEGVVRTGPGGRSYPFIFSIPVHAAYGSMVALKELRKQEPKKQKSKLNGEDSQAGDASSAALQNNIKR